MLSRLTRSIVALLTLTFLSQCGRVVGDSGCTGDYSTEVGLSIVNRSVVTESKGKRDTTLTRVVYRLDFEGIDAKNVIQKVELGVPCACAEDVNWKEFRDLVSGDGVTVGKDGIVVNLKRYKADGDASNSVDFTIYLNGDYTGVGLLSTEATIRYRGKGKAKVAIQSKFPNICGALEECSVDDLDSLFIGWQCGDVFIDDAPLESAFERVLLNKCDQWGWIDLDDTFPYIADDDACGSAIEAARHWYSYYAHSDGTVTFSTCYYGGFDTVIHVFEAGCDSTGYYRSDDAEISNCVAYNDDYCGKQSQVTIDVSAGEVYLIVVHYSNPADYWFGYYLLSTNFSYGSPCPHTAASTGLIFDGPQCGTVSYDDVAAGLDSAYNRLLVDDCVQSGDTTAADDYGDGWNLGCYDGIYGYNGSNPAQWFSYWADADKNVTFEIIDALNSGYSNFFDADLTLFAAEQNIDGSWPSVPQLGTCLEYDDCEGSGCSYPYWPKITYYVQSCRLYFIAVHGYQWCDSTCIQGWYQLEVSQVISS